MEIVFHFGTFFEQYAKMFVIKRIDTSGNTVTIDADSAQTIDGSLTITLAPYESVTLVCPNTGTDWMVN